MDECKWLQTGESQTEPIGNMKKSPKQDKIWNNQCKEQKKMSMKYNE